MKSWSDRLAKIILCAALALTASAAFGAGSIKVWYPLGYSKVDAGGHRYFAVATDKYKFVYDLGHPGMTELYNLAKTPAGGPNLLQTSGVPGSYIDILDGNSVGYLSYLSNGNALVTVTKGPNTFPNVFQTRMTFRQSGRVYYQLDVSGIKLATAGGAVAPITVKQRFHIWPDKFYVETIFSPSGDVSVRFAEHITGYDPSRFDRVCSGALGTVTPTTGFTHYLAPTDPYAGLIDRTGSNGSVASVCVSRNGTDSFVMFNGPYLSAPSALCFIHRAYDYDVRGGVGSWHAGEMYSIYSQYIFSDKADSTDLSADAQLEANPASITRITSSSGASTAITYDNTCGSYRVEIPSDYSETPFGYNYADVYLNHYETAMLHIANGSAARLLRLKTVRGSSFGTSTPWGELMVTDAAGFPIGVSTEQNSAWEGSEPDRYFACYTSIPMAASETRDIDLKLIGNNWGKKPMIRMQCQDLTGWEGGADEQQWMQSSIGQGENMCYHLQRVWCTVEDARGHDSRLLGDSSAWRDNCGGWEFFKLASGLRPDTKSLVYRKSGPNLMDFTISGATDDGLITSDVRVIAVPATEVTRTFFHIRYDVHGTVSLGGAASSVLRLFALGDENYGGVTYPNVAYTNSSGTVINQSAGSSFNGRTLGSAAPWACTYGASMPLGTGGNRGFVVRSFQGRANATTRNTPAITLNSGSQTRLILTTNAGSTQLVNGDYFEFDLETVAYGDATSGYSRMQSEAAAFGPGKPFVNTVYHGTKVTDFPSRIDIAGDGYADFSILGGRDMIPIEIGGFASYTNPSCSDLRIEELVGSVWIPLDQSVVGRDWWQTEYDDATAKYSFLLAIHTDGSTRRFRVCQLLNKSEAELCTAKSADLAVFNIPSIAGGAYLAGIGDSPIMAGEYFVHDVSNTASQARKFTPFIRYAAVVDGAIHLEVNGANSTGAVSLPSTGSPALWRTMPLPDVTLNAGTNSVRVVFESGGSYIDWLEYRLERPTTAVADDAMPVSDLVPYNISSNIPNVCSVTMRNAGTSTWTAAGGYGLTSDDEFGLAAIHPVASDVGPGASYTFTFTCAAPPATVKLYQTKWQMKKQTLAFGTPITRPQRSTDVVRSYENAILIGDDIPIRLSVREARTVTVVMRNVGTTTWTGPDFTDYYGLSKADGAFGQSDSRSLLANGERVVPGQDRAFLVRLVAPSTPGIYSVRLRMKRYPSGNLGNLVVRRVEVVADASPPGTPVVLDGGAFSSSTSLSASWTAWDYDSGVTDYQYAVGTSPVYTGSSLVRGWTAVGSAAFVTASALTLAMDTTYYFYVRARNGAGMWSPVGTSDGITVVRGATGIAQLKLMSPGTQFQLPPLPVAGVGYHLAFIEDVSTLTGLKLNWQGTEPILTKLATVAGVYRGVIDYEPTADALDITQAGDGTAHPLGLSNRALSWQGPGGSVISGAAPICLLVKTWGRITYTGAGFFLIDDGTNVSDHFSETGHYGIKVVLPSGAIMPEFGALLPVTGVCRPGVDGKRYWLMPRSAADITPF